MNQQSELADTNLRHGNRVRFLRRVFPIFVLLFLLGWFAFGQLERLNNFAQTMNWIVREFDQVENGFIRTFRVNDKGEEEERRIGFAKMEGTGLRGRPLELGDVDFQLLRQGAVKYNMVMVDATMVPQTGMLSSTSNVRVDGPDGLLLSGDSAEIDMLSFDTFMEGDVALSADGGLSATSQTGVELKPRLGTFTLLGKSSAFLPRNLPDLE